MTSTSHEIFSQTKRRLKMRFIDTVGDAVGVIHAKFQDDLPRGFSEMVHPSWLDSKVVMTQSSDEIFSQTKRRLKMRFMGTLVTTVGVIPAKLQEDLLTCSSVIFQPSLP